VCKMCGCGFLERDLTPAELDAIYRSNYFVEEHPGYTKDISSQVDDVRSCQNILLDRIEQFRSLKGSRFLDVGAAAGVMMLAAKKRGASVQGVEPSEFASRHAAEQLGLNVQCATLESAELDGQLFDAVTLIDVIEHVTDLQGDMKKLRGCLRKGGLLALLTPNFKLHRLFGRRWHGFNASYEHVLYLDEASLGMLLRRNGFRVLQVETFGMVDLAQYYLHPLARWLSLGMVARVNRVFSKLLRVLKCEHRLFIVAQAEDVK
jgi:2-polyprenyl-3-methyl-5-hydroxy-6-metoxy-1,4-benzoquinol methylase